MFCPNCGCQMPEGYPFCSNCGTRFENSYANQQPQYAQPQYAPQKKNVNLLSMIAMAAALVLAGMAAGFFLSGGRDSGNDTPNQPESGNHVQIEEEKEEEQRFSGWVVSAKWEYDKEGQLKLGHTYEYDILGRVSKDQHYNKDKEPTRYDVYTYDLDGGYTVTTYINEDDRTYIVDRFNAKGETVLHLVYDSDGNESLRHDYIYDGEGRLLRRESLERETRYREEYTYDDAGNNILYIYFISGMECSRTVMTYDEAGNMIREERIPNPEYSGSSEPEIYEYTYDDRGNLLKKQHIYRGENQEYWEYTYDEENRLLFYGRYNRSGKKVDYKEYSYNEQGLVASFKGYADNTYPPVFQNFVYEYDEQGREIVKYTYDAVEWLLSTTYTQYNERGDIAYIYSVDAQDRLQNEVLFEYDDQGNLLLRHFTKENNEVGDTYPGFTLNQYTYDEHGNMTSEKFYQNQETPQYHYEYEYTFIT